MSAAYAREHTDWHDRCYHWSGRCRSDGELRGMPRVETQSGGQTPPTNGALSYGATVTLINRPHRSVNSNERIGGPMEHPLLAMMQPAGLTESDQDELLRAAGALQSLGWTRERVDSALHTAIEVAGERVVSGQRPVVIYCDQEPGAYVAVRLPLSTGPREATELSQKLRDRLESRDLDRPGLSISFWSVRPGTRSRAT